jgi:hypothetical protein
MVWGLSSHQLVIMPGLSPRYEAAGVCPSTHQSFNPTILLLTYTYGLCAGHSHDGGGDADASGRRQPRCSEDANKASRSNSRNASNAGGSEQRGLRGLFFNILRSRCVVGVCASGWLQNCWWLLAVSGVACCIKDG